MNEEQKKRKAQKERERREHLNVDQQAKIEPAPETAMQAPPPKFASPLDMQWKSPNGDPFDNMYKRQRQN